MVWTPSLGRLDGAREVKLRRFIELAEQMVIEGDDRLLKLALLAVEEGVVVGA